MNSITSIFFIILIILLLLLALLNNKINKNINKNINSIINYKYGGNIDKIKFVIYNKKELLDILTKKNENQKKYINFLNLYKKEYLSTLSSKFNINLIDYIINDQKFILNSDHGAKIYYIFTINEINNPIAITKVLTLSKSDEYYKQIINYINSINTINTLKYQEFIYIHNTFVLKNYRGKGINGQMLNYIIKLNIFKHIKYVIIVIKDTNLSSIKSRLKEKFIKTNILQYQPNSYFYYKKII